MECTLSVVSVINNTPDLYMLKLNCDNNFSGSKLCYQSSLYIK